jgi:hypothetical protein
MGLAPLQSAGFVLPQSHHFPSPIGGVADPDPTPRIFAGLLAQGAELLELLLCEAEAGGRGVLLQVLDR